MTNQWSGIVKSAAGVFPLSLLLFCAVADGLAAEDVVEYVRTDKTAQLRGTVLDYTGDFLTVELPSGRRTQVPAARVLSIQTDWCADHAEGNRLAAEREFEAALAKYRAAVKAERRRWAQRQILAETVWTLRHLNRYEQAGDTFLVLVGDDPHTPYIDCIPLCWAPQQPSLLLRRRAEAWLAEGDGPAALLGASWLLSSRDRAAATTALQRLKQDPHPIVRGLAAAQLWRTRMATATLAEVGGWQRAVEQLPGPLRPGPTFVVARALARLDRAEAAALEFLRIPILHPRHASLAAQGLLGAGIELEKVGQTTESAALYRELVRDYPDTKEAAEADACLQRMILQ